jgi:BirA family biotin operon repressor/biotin-[acetyl-CoA-carboxylase] ligase
MNIIEIESTSSTNTYLKELADIQDLEEGTVVTAYRQSSGRGQSGNTWESEPGKNLTFSIILYPIQLPVKQQFMLSKIISISIKDVLNLYTDEIMIKWPNDIYYKDRKITGILIENEINGDHFSRSVIGIGLNVNQETFSGHNTGNAVSLKQITGKETGLDELLLLIMEKLTGKYHALLNGEADLISQDYFASLYRNDGYYPYSDANGQFMARIDHVEDNGLFVLKTNTGELRYYAFKELTYCL